MSKRAPDVLCLQETKCPDELFPFDRFHALGYAHVEIHGQKGYHGVATISRRPIEVVERRRFCEIADSRHLSVRVEAGGRSILVHNFYVPAGGDEPDPEINPKFRHKLDFVAEMNAMRAEQDDALRLDPRRRPEHRAAGARRLVAQAAPQGRQPHAGRDRELRGDAQGRRLGRPDAAERARRAEALHLVELPRRRLGGVRPRPPARPHLVVRKSRAGLAGIDILREARGWDRPSDHVPVIARFDFD